MSCSGSARAVSIMPERAVCPRCSLRGCSWKEFVSAASAQSCQVLLFESSSLQQASEHVSNTYDVHTCAGHMVDMVCLVSTRETHVFLKTKTVRNTQSRTIEDSKRYSCHYRGLPLGIAVKQVLHSKNSPMMNSKVMNWCIQLYPPHVFISFFFTCFNE